MREIWVYVVVGSTGEYSDRSEWYVAAYFDEELAKEHVMLADEKGRELFASDNTWKGRIEMKGKNPWDPDGQSPDYTGWTYYYESVPFAGFDHLLTKRSLAGNE